MTISGKLVPPLLIFLILSIRLVAYPPICAAQHAIPKVGLALSGGGARGAAHIGVLKVLEREKIPIDCIAGTSFGALIGGLYAIGYKATEIEQIFLQQDWDSIFSDTPNRRLSPLIERGTSRYQGQLAFRGLSPELPAGLREGQRIIEILNILTSQRMIEAQYDFDKLPIPFRAVATDILTGKPYIFSHGRMTEALRASIAIPGLFTPVEKDDMLLVDGGLADNFPTDIVRGMGADIVIGIDVTAPLLKKGEIKTILNVMDQTLSLLMRQNMAASEKKANLIMRPDLDGFSFTSYDQIAEVIKRGQAIAESRSKDLEELVAGIPPYPHPQLPSAMNPPVIESIEFAGLKKIPRSQVEREIKTKPGQPMSTEMLRHDLSRLYAMRLFDQVDSNMEPLGGNRYRLIYLFKEAPLNTLGASIRYDRDYKFVALAEITVRELFHTPSMLTLSSQFGGLENHSAALRYTPTRFPFLFVEPRVHLRRLERNDYRNGEFVDRFTDKRNGGQVMIGGTFFKRLEVEAGYRDDSVNIAGGTEPNRQNGSLRLAGLTARARRDTLDAPDFPSSGMLVHLQADKRSESLGGDVSYTKFHADLDRFFPITRKGTLEIRGAAGYTRGPIPFYDQFFIGGYNFSDLGPIQFFGFNRDELLARQMGIAGGSYRYQLFNHPLSFARRAYVGIHYNFAAISTSPAGPYRFAFFNGGGISLAIDTLLGPMRAAWGLGEGGRNVFYLSLGPGF